MPLLTELKTVNLALLLLSLVFNIAIFIFIMVSVLVVQSLVQVSIQRQGFENGINRMLGMTKHEVVFGMTAVRSLAFVLPAMLLALIFGEIILSWISMAVFQDDDHAVSFAAIGQAAMVGFAVPIISSISPMLETMKHSLNESLSTNRSKVKAVIIQVLNRKNRQKELLLPYISIGLMAVAHGFAIYYLMPLAFLSMNYGLLLQVFFLILMAMFQGLVLLAQNLQRITEIAFSTVFFKVMLWEPPQMRYIVQNNMKAHSIRNKQTSFIFASAIGFTIFLLVQYKLIRQQNDLEQMRKSGTYPYLSTSYEYAIRPEYADQVLYRNRDKIEAFAWISFEQLRVYQSGIQQTTLLDISQIFRTTKFRLYGVTPQTFNTVQNSESSIFMGVHYQQYGYQNLMESLYTRSGS